MAENVTNIHSHIYLALFVSKSCYEKARYEGTQAIQGTVEEWGLTADEVTNDVWEAYLWRFLTRSRCLNDVFRPDW